MRKGWGLLVLLLLMPGGTRAAPAPLEEGPATVPRPGELLVAAPELGDPRFDHTVVLMLQHDAEGAMGVVINRPYGKAPTAELLRRLGVDAGGVAGETLLVYGGPVQPEAGFVVHSTEYALPDTHPLAAGLAVTSDPTILKDMATGRGPKQAVPVLGYAGWGPGQLEGELAERAWFVIPADAELIFAPDPTRTWQRAMDRRGIEL